MVASAWHEERNAHGEQMLGLMERVFTRAEWTRADIDRVAVGTGPGSFTGLRVGLSLGQGIAIGLGLECVGVGSLEAMTAAAATAATAGDGPRCAVLDALRGEVFVAVYGADGAELLAPRAVLREDFPEKVFDIIAIQGIATDELVFVGEDPCLADLNAINAPEAALPHAIWTARLAAGRSDPAEPIYVRGADAIKPKMPPNPLKA